MQYTELQTALFALDST